MSSAGIRKLAAVPATHFLKMTSIKSAFFSTERLILLYEMSNNIMKGVNKNEGCPWESLVGILSNVDEAERLKSLANCALLQYNVRNMCPPDSVK